MSRTYFARPPATAKAARHAWDYFLRTRGKTRGIKEMFYSRHFNLNGGAHWVCVLNMRDRDLDHWNFSESDLTWALPCDYLSRQELPPQVARERSDTGRRDRLNDPLREELNLPTDEEA